VLGNSAEACSVTLQSMREFRAKQHDPSLIQPDKGEPVGLLDSSPRGAARGPPGDGVRGAWERVAGKTRGRIIFDALGTAFGKRTRRASSASPGRLDVCTTGGMGTHGS